MALVFVNMHFYNLLNFVLLLSIPVVYFITNLVFADQTEGSTNPACPCLMCFFNTGNSQGTKFLKLLSLMFVYVCSIFSKLCLG